VDGRVKPGHDKSLLGDPFEEPRRIVEAEIVVAGEMDHGAFGERGDGE
jgi:hypothetical protein